MQIDTKDVLNFLKSRNADGACHRCGNTLFSMLDGQVNIPTNNGKVVETVIVICQTCGAVTNHALSPMIHQEQENEMKRKLDETYNRAYKDGYMAGKAENKLN